MVRGPSAASEPRRRAVRKRLFSRNVVNVRTPFFRVMKYLIILYDYRETSAKMRAKDDGEGRPFKARGGYQEISCRYQEKLCVYQEK